MPPSRSLASKPLPARMILQAERNDLLDAGRSDVDDRQGVVFLERGPGGPAVGRDGDVFGLDVLRERGPAVGRVDIRSRNPHALPFKQVTLAVEAEEVGRKGDGMIRVLADVDHADRTFGVDGIVVARLAFIGGEDVATVGSERHHVGQRADANDGDRLVVRRGVWTLRRGTEQHDVAGIRLAWSDDRHRHQAVTRGDARRIAEERYVQPAQFLARLRVEPHHTPLGAVAHQKLLGVVVVDDDLRPLESAGVVRPDVVELHRGERARRH